MQELPLPSRYRVLHHVASGGMAGVWAAHDEVLGRDVAVKLLATHLSEDEDARMRFQREARAAAGLSSHRNVVTIYDVGEHEGRSFITMELLKGGTLADVLRGGGPVDPERAIGWLRSAADALDAAHERGIVHRDIKPANLLLDEQGRLSVGDFGIARLAWEDQVTQTGQILGTASYISPEQAAGDPATDASDRYSLAVVAFQLLTGRRPFESEHFAAQARAHVEDPPPEASSLNPALPKAVDAVLAQGLAKDPARRWPRSRDLVEALASALESEEVADEPTAATVVAPATEPSRIEPAPAAVAAAPPAGPERDRDGTFAGAVPPAPTHHPVARHRGPGRGLWLALALGAALLAIVLAASALSGGDEDGERTAGGNAEPTATATATPTAEKTAEPTPTAAATQEPAPVTPQGSGNGKGKAKGKAKKGDPSALNAQGFALMNQGNYEGAIEPLQQAVDNCEGSTAVDPCAYALYNLGASLRRAGRPEEAIPVLEERLERFGSNQRATVQKELDAAKADAGQ